VGSKIVQTMYCIIFTTTKKTIHGAKFLVVSCDEMISIHVYFMDGFKHILIFLNLERLVNGGTFDNLINVIFNSLLIYGLHCVRD